MIIKTRALFISLTVLSALSLNQPGCAQTDFPTESDGQTSAAIDDPTAHKRCEDYIKCMHAVVQTYERTISTTLIGDQAIKTDPATMRAAALTTLKLARQMKSIKPPNEIAFEHQQLAASLPTLHDLFALNKGGMDGLGKGLSLAWQIQSTLGAYHNALLAMIARHNLDPALDPIAMSPQ